MKSKFFYDIALGKLCIYLLFLCILIIQLFKKSLSWASKDFLSGNISTENYKRCSLKSQSL